MKDLLLRARNVARMSNMKFSHYHLAERKKKNCTKKHASRATIMIFPHSPNHISDLWHCHFLKSLVPFQHMVSLSL